MPRLLVWMSAGVIMSLNACAGLRTPPVDPYAGIRAAVDQLVEGSLTGAPTFDFPRGTAVDTILWDDRNVEIVLSEELSRKAFRPNDVRNLYDALDEVIRPFLGGRHLSLSTLGVPVSELVPNPYRGTSLQIDSSRVWLERDRPRPLVSNLDQGFTAPAGLDGRNIALWPSHGWYYDNRNDVWRWQRLRMFQTVEDLLTLSFAVPYLTPMLENAGANVFLPRERDPQTAMVVIDNDSSSALAGTLERRGTWGSEAPGFAAGNPPYVDGHNPFQAGTYLSTVASSQSDTLKWVPTIPRTGEYAVYISYASVQGVTDDARYSVFHAGGKTDFSVNQRIGGGTWVYLGTFRFRSNGSSDSASVMLTTAGISEGERLTADAVRFGGGRGIIARNGQASGRPRFVEGARYHLLYSGMPDSLVYNLHGSEDDYRDDYQSRGEWVNYLRGSPYGPNRDREASGLGIPIDLSLAMHTDAGTRGPDTTVGTLAIYSVEGADSATVFPNGVSRFANRDLADLVQTQLVGDIRLLHDSTFARRSLLEAQYSEAFRPNVPSLLLELFSHQNPEDARLGLDPRVRFDGSRAIYKALLKFVAFQNGFEYVVQPLPPSHFAAVADHDGVNLRWRPTTDPLESTAAPDFYIVYTRVGDGGWDNGVRVDSTNHYVQGLAAKRMYSFRVTAANSGGQSFPSEVLSVTRAGPADRKVLIVNGFDRVSPPEFLEADSMRGVAFFLDEGVPDRVDLSFTGYQFNYNGRQIWHSDNAPYHGASHADFDTVAVAGNTFDFARVHGASVVASGFGFDSASDESVAAGMIDLSAYSVMDLILGEEKRTSRSRSSGPPDFEAFPVPLREKLRDFASAGGRLFVSGAHVASDLLGSAYSDSSAKSFADSVLHISMVTTHASRRGLVHSVDSTISSDEIRFRFNTDLSPETYAVEAADGLLPVGAGAETLLRYSENNLAAGVGFRGNHRVVVFGFPFEVVMSQRARDDIMERVLSYLLEE